VIRLKFTNFRIEAQAEHSQQDSVLKDHMSKMGISLNRSFAGMSY